MLDLASGSYRQDPIVVVKGDRIESIGSERPDGISLLDVGDRVLLPGLIDAHTHIFLQGNVSQADFRAQIMQEYPSHRVARAVRSLQLAADHGFLYLRDL